MATSYRKFMTRRVQDYLHGILVVLPMVFLKCLKAARTHTHTHKGLLSSGAICVALLRFSYAVLCVIS